MAPVKPVPWTVTTVPPLTVPVDGSINVTAGIRTAIDVVVVELVVEGVVVVVEVLLDVEVVLDVEVLLEGEMVLEVLDVLEGEMVLEVLDVLDGEMVLEVLDVLDGEMVLDVVEVLDVDDDVDVLEVDVEDVLVLDVEVEVLLEVLEVLDVDEVLEVLEVVDVDDVLEEVGVVVVGRVVLVVLVEVGGNCGQFNEPAIRSNRGPNPNSAKATWSVRRVVQARASWSLFSAWVGWAERPFAHCDNHASCVLPPCGAAAMVGGAFKAEKKMRSEQLLRMMRRPKLRRCGPTNQRPPRNPPESRSLADVGVAPSGMQRVCHRWTVRQLCRLGRSVTRPPATTRRNRTPQSFVGGSVTMGQCRGRCIEMVTHAAGP